MPDISPTPQNAAEYADYAVAASQNAAGIQRDYSPDSLRFVDELILGFRDEGHTTDTMSETLILFGCYLGEVILRNLGGTWKMAEETSFKNYAPPGTLVLETPQDGVLNPIGKSFKLIQNGNEDSLAFFYQVVATRSRS